MKRIAQSFFMGSMQIDLRDALKSIRSEAKAERKRPDALWRRLCAVVATSGSSVNADAFMRQYETSLAFDVLPKTDKARTRVIHAVLVDAKVPRMREKKANDLSRNYAIVRSLGGPIQATKTMLALSGKNQKQRWIRQFDGVGLKYSNDIWMSIYDPDFADAIAIDTRVQNFAVAMGFKKSATLENELLEFAKRCRLTGWEFDRLIYNYGTLILKTLERRSKHSSKSATQR